MIIRASRAALQSQGTEGEERIIDGVRVITGGAYGFDDACEFRSYLPGMQTKNLPEAYLSWVGWPLTRGSTDSSASSVLTFYGLYNVGGEQGFYSDDAIARLRMATGLRASAPGKAALALGGTRPAGIRFIIYRVCAGGRGCLFRAGCAAKRKQAGAGRCQDHQQ